MALPEGRKMGWFFKLILYGPDGRGSLLLGLKAAKQGTMRSEPDGVFMARGGMFFRSQRTENSKRG
jgi:hypothetical protein